MEVPKLVPVEAGGSAPPVYVMQETIPGLVPAEPTQPPLPGFQSPARKQYYAEGKQVLQDGVHYADAASPDAASCIVDALNGVEEQASWAYLVAQAK